MGKKGKNTNGWFVGYAPRRNPEIVVAAVVQDTDLHGGSTAGPVVRDIVKAYYDKKNAHLQQQQAMVNSPTGPRTSPAPAMPKVTPASAADHVEAAAATPPLAATEETPHP
jgi:penicillin-binding protein 2